MRPLGWFGQTPFLLALPFAALLGTLVLLARARNDHAPLGRVLIMQGYLAVLAVLGAKLFALFELHGLGRALPPEASGGFRYPGGLIGILIALLVVKPLALPGVALGRYADWLAPTVAFSHAVIRVGCFLTGCCTGGVCHSAWCVAFPRGSGPWTNQLTEGAILPTALQSEPVFPLQLAFLAVAVSVGLILLWWDRRRWFDGQTFLAFLVLHEGGKGALESLRVPHLPALQAVSLLAAAVGLIALIVGSANQPRRKSRLRI